MLNPHTFLERIATKECVVGIVGLGYVGLPLALTFMKKGFRCVGFDIDSKKIDMLRQGESYIRHIPSASLRDALEKKLLSATTDFAQLSTCDAIILCVPTPLNKNREPDMSYIENTALAVAPYLKKGQLVSLESTTYPGTTDELLRGILESKQPLVAGKDFFLAYSPEREDPGNAHHNTETIPKVVGGLTPACLEAACGLYGAALQRVVPVSSTRVAEMSKLLENIFRCVNIALVNELKMVAERMNIDVWEVIEAASSKPFGYMPFYPGPGLGGHCIPIDPFYLTWKAREYEISSRFIELAGETNTHMPYYVLERTLHALNTHAKALNKSRILIMGLAYKKDVDDVRESPALRIIELLSQHGAQVSYHDPYIPHTHKMRHHDVQLSSVPLTEDTLKTYDAVLIVTDHSNIDYAWVVEHATLVIDSRNATKYVTQGREKIFKT
jgi:UDP-N-acetyl-D-glucosamine dehydrogenase